MQLSSLFALAVGLSMDAAAVAASRGLATPVLAPRHFVRIAVTFGGMQALMPLLGWAFGVHLGPWVAAWDHWIAFGLLSVLGVKMILDAWSGDDDHDDVDAAALGARDPQRDLYSSKELFALGVATSLDAFAVGITLPMLGASLVSSLLVIGLTTAVLSALALALGRKLGDKLGPGLDVFGGVVLIALGAKILAEHLELF